MDDNTKASRNLSREFASCEIFMRDEDVMEAMGEIQVVWTLLPQISKKCTSMPAVMQ